MLFRERHETSPFSVEHRPGGHEDSVGPFFDQRGERTVKLIGAPYLLWLIARGNRKGSDG